MADRRHSDNPSDAGGSAPGGPPAKVVSFEARVSGRVQGVGFRMWTVDTAQRLGINGRVRNAYNGDVEVEAEGTRELLEDFLRRLREGPILSRVRNIDVDWDERAPRFKGFGVDY